jgi:hypothetical protein
MITVRDTPLCTILAATPILDLTLVAVITRIKTRRKRGEIRSISRDIVLPITSTKNNPYADINAKENADEYTMFLQWFLR